MIFDVSEANGGQPFDTLSNALTCANNVLLDSQKKGGMSIKFIQGSAQSSDNKYVEYFLPKNEWSDNEENWERVNIEKEAQANYSDVVVSPIMGIIKSSSVDYTNPSQDNICIRKEVVPGKEYVLFVPSPRIDSNYYYAFTYDIQGSTFAYRGGYKVGYNYLTAPLGAKYLFVQVRYDGAGDLTGYQLMESDVRIKENITGLKRLMKNGYDAVVLKESCYIGSDSKIKSSSSSVNYSASMEVVEGKKYVIYVKEEDISDSPYYLFTSDIDGASPIGERILYQAGTNIITAPTGANFLWVNMTFNSVGEPKGYSIFELNEYLKYAHDTASENAEILEGFGDINDLETTDKSTLVKAINEVYEGMNQKLNKVRVTSSWVEESFISQENGYIDSTGNVAGTSYKIQTFTVIASNKYRITGSRAGSSSRLACFYVDNGQGGLTPYNGQIQKVGSNGEGETISYVSNPVPDGTASGGGVVSDYHTEVYIAPENAVAVKIMTRDKTNQPPKCEKYVESATDNQETIDSIGDATQLNTENKSTLVEAINEVNSKADKAIKLLLVGSSHGMNTISQVPWIAYKSGIYIEVGSVYIGSFSLQRMYGMIQRGEKTSFKYFKGGSWTSYTNKTFAEVFNWTDWDFISLQRSATDDQIWTLTQNEADTVANAMTNINYNVAGAPAIYMSHNEALQFALDYIKAHSSTNANIIFNTGFGDAANYTPTDSATRQIIESAELMKKNFGIEYYSTARALLNARQTFLRNYGTYDSGTSETSNNLCYDSQHLDYGIGCYVVGICLLEFVFRKLGLDTELLRGYGTFEDMDGWWVSPTASNYTTPTLDMMNCAKACAKAALNDDTATSTDVAARFKWEIKYTLGSGITSTNTRTYSGNTDKYVTTLSGETSVQVTSRASKGDTPTDITSSVYESSTHTITIESVEGDIVISAS